MIERGSGHVVITGSLSGFRGLPGAIGYSSSKAGIMALAESMQADLRTSPIQVQVVNPGFIKTRLTDKNDFNMPFIMDVEDAAQEMFEHMNSDRFKELSDALFMASPAYGLYQIGCVIGCSERNSLKFQQISAAA